MTTVNLYDIAVPTDGEDRPAGFRRTQLQLGPLLNASRLGATLYEIPPGERIAPYHYEHNNEEWLLVLTGTPTMRAPSGMQRLRPGDLIAFTEGPQGAHLVANDGEETARVVMLSTKRTPAVAIYPDSNKLALRRVGNDGIIVRRSDGVDYWEGEAT